MASASLASIGSIGGAMAYNSLRLRVGMFGRLLREALWAPLAIVLLAVAVGRLRAAADLWWLVHVLGGAALAFCYLRAIDIGRAWLGVLRPPAKYLLAFGLACTTAVGWEIGEFIIDQLAGTALQEGNLDTMSDLILGTGGAAGYLAWHALRRATR
jgi:hypothetical protein